MTKTRIDAADIRKGDLIRWERIEEAAGVERAVEYRAPRDRHEHPGLSPRSGKHYLLDRPRPPFTPVPTEALEGLIQVASLCDATYPDYRKAIESFLATIEANA